MVAKQPAVCGAIYAQRPGVQQDLSASPCGKPQTPDPQKNWCQEQDSVLGGGKHTPPQILKSWLAKILVKKYLCSYVRPR